MGENANNLPGIGPDAVIDWGKKTRPTSGSRKRSRSQKPTKSPAETYAEIARVHAEAAARLPAETKEIETRTGKVGQKLKEQEDLIKLLDQRIERSNELLKKVKRRR